MNTKYALTLSYDDCKDCYKCIRHCPVKAISVIDNTTEVVANRCIACGQCFIICPQNNMNLQYDLLKVRSFIRDNKKLVASVDPTFLAYFKGQAGKLISLLRNLGFEYIEETAVAIDTLREEYKDFYKKTQQKYFISSTCSASNLMVQKYYPELSEYMLPMLPPMLVHGRMLKKKYGEDSKIVYFSPCIASKIECSDLTQEEELIDAVLTFEELRDWIVLKGIDLEDLDGDVFDNEGSKEGKCFPTEGLLLKTMIDNRHQYLSINGSENTREILESLKKQEIDDAFIELSYCLNGCINGPVFNNNSSNVFLRKKIIKEYAENTDTSNKVSLVHNNKEDFSREFLDKRVINLQPSKIQTRNILKEMGMFKESDELNCGTCGYDTCEDKAVAIFNNMDKTDMCLPYIRNKNETISNLIFEYSPNYIFLVNRNLKISSINPAAVRNLDVEKHQEDLHIATILDFNDYMEVFENKKSNCGKKIKLENPERILIQNLLYIDSEDAILAILNDITQIEEKEKALMEVKQNTIDMVQKVITKQMMVTQEICSVLGETTAETRVILKKFLDITAEKSGDL